jgi:hypothetical protein
MKFTNKEYHRLRRVLLEKSEYEKSFIVAVDNDQWFPFCEEMVARKILIRIPLKHRSKLVTKHNIFRKRIGLVKRSTRRNFMGYALTDDARKWILFYTL